MWVAIAIGLFVLGSIMALKPSAIDVRLDKLRMTARRLGLNPKLIACPDWIRGQNDEFGKGMIGQYCLIMDDMKFTETHYRVINGKLKLEDISASSADSSRSTLVNQSGSLPIVSSVLNLQDQPVTLPAHMVPLVKGVYLKANSLVVFWQDTRYVQPATNPEFKIQHIEPDLLALKSLMQSWAEKLANKD